MVIYLVYLGGIISENGKYYITFSSAEEKTNIEITQTSTIDTWRGYVDDTNNFIKDKYGIDGGIVAIGAKYSIANSIGRQDFGGTSLATRYFGFGFNIISNKDNEYFTSTGAQNTNYYNLGLNKSGNTGDGYVSPQ